MKETLITFETAKLAKEKGYPQTAGKMFDNGKLKKVSLSLGHPSDYKDRFYSAPTQSLLQKWLREVHNIIVQPKYEHILSCSCDIDCRLELFRINNDRGSCSPIHTQYINTGFDTYEQALEAGLQEALKLIK